MKSGLNNIELNSNGLKLKGHLYCPENFDAEKQYPAIIFSNPVTGIKEQVVGNYAAAMAKKGYVALAFDPRNWGESEGSPRFHFNPFDIVEDVRNAISYISTLPFVNKEKLTGAGICSGSAFMGLVGITDKRLKSIANVSGLNDHTSLTDTDTYQDLDMDAILSYANQARQKYYETGEVDLYPLIQGDPNSPYQFTREAYDYYNTKRAGTEKFPTYNPMGTAMSIENMLIFSAARFADKLTTPLITIIGEIAETKEQTMSFHEPAKGPKELIEIKGASHMGLYDNPELIEEVCGHLDAFFKKYSN